MRIATEIKTQWLEPASDELPVCSRVWLPDREGPQVVKGELLEVAVAWEKYYVLLMNSGGCFEEFLYIHLLDDKLNLLDSATIGTWYSTGTFEHVQLEPPDQIQFIFMARWRITLFPSFRWRIPLVSEPGGVWRAFGVRRHFVIERLPDPPEEKTLPSADPPDTFF